METLQVICYLLGQMMVIWPFMAATSRLLGQKMCFRQRVLYVLISPPFAYFYVTLCFVAARLLIQSDIVQWDTGAITNVLRWGDLYALGLSFLLAYIYSRRGQGKDKLLRIFVYLCCYASSMVFDQTFETPVTVIVLGLIVPFLFSYGMYRTLAKHLPEIRRHMQFLNGSMLYFAFLSEMLLVLRFSISIILFGQNVDKGVVTGLYCVKLIFGYAVHALMLIGFVMMRRHLKNVREMEEKNRQLTARNEEIHRLSVDALRALAAAVDAKDTYTNGHSSRVSTYAAMIARKMGYAPEAVDKIRKAAFLHDIGKIAIPDAVLKKPGKLTDEEYAQIKIHSEKGYEILLKLEEMPELAIGARYHHERWNGKGYPEGLAGEAIPDISRIIAVADAFDAMTYDRIYCAPQSVQYARSEIEKCSGLQFDPAAARAMLALIDENQVPLKEDGLAASGDELTD